MKTIQRVTAALCAVCMLLAGFAFTASAQSVRPGDLEGRDDVQEAGSILRWREMAAGYAFDSALVMVDASHAAQAASDLAKDPRVASCRSLIFPEYLSVELKTADPEALDAFIADCGAMPYTVIAEKNHYAYIPESRFAVTVDLNIYRNEPETPGMDALLPLKYDFTPADFNAQKVKNVYVSTKTGPGLNEHDQQLLASIFDEINDPEFERLYAEGIPTRLVLELNDASPDSAAAFALALTDYEHSGLFTGEQKQMFRERLLGVDLLEYDGFSDRQPIPALLRERTFLIRLPSENAEAYASEIRTAAAQTEFPIGGDAGRYLYKVCDDSAHALYFLRLDGASYDEIIRFSSILNGLGAKCFTCLNGVELALRGHFDEYMNGLFGEGVGRPGDIDGDGGVTSADARLALRAAVELDVLSGTKKAAADVDADGSVTAADAREILRASVELTDPETLKLTVAQGDAACLGPYFDSDAGFVWTLEAEDGEPVEITEKRWSLPDNMTAPGDILGKVFLIRAKTPGTYRLKLTYRRPWLDAAEQSRTVLVAVRPNDFYRYYE